MMSTKKFVAVLALLAILISENGCVSGQYFRYGSLSWEQLSIVSDGIMVRFTLTTAWKRNFFDKSEDAAPVGGCTNCNGVGAPAECTGTQTLGCVLPVPGDTVTLFDRYDETPAVSMTFTFGFNTDDFLTGERNNNNVPVCRATSQGCITGRVVDAYKNESDVPLPETDAADMVYVVSTIDYKYPKETRTFIAKFQGCCRMGDGSQELRNNARGGWEIRTDVALSDSQTVFETGTARAPFFSHVPTVPVLKGRPLTLQLYAFDAANRPITYSIGTNTDHGVGLNENAGEPFGNSFGATLDAASGQLTFPATASTSYEQYYNLVVLATVLGPCSGYDSENPSAGCLDPAGDPQTNIITTIVDFNFIVVFAGYTGLPPQTSCDNGDSGLPAGTKVCNNYPVLTVPISPQKFICGEENSFSVTLEDGIGFDKTVQSGAFAIRHRQRMVLPTTVPSSPYFPSTSSECCVRNYAALNQTTGGPTQAYGVYRWNPTCERLEDEVLYNYAGRHRLDVFGVCFVGVDSGGMSVFSGKLNSPPGCVKIPLLRCTKPTIQLFSSTLPPTNATTRLYTVTVATNISLLFNGTDDKQTRDLTIFHTSDPGIPSTGVEWEEPFCLLDANFQVVCNPSSRVFNFHAGLIHAGTTPMICFEAVNDQVECPLFRPNVGSQPYGLHENSADITVSQSSEPLCFHFDVPGARIEWLDPTPAEESTVLTYMGCPVDLILSAEDQENYFNLRIEAFTEEFTLPDGVTLDPPVCKFKDGVPAPTVVAAGVGTCPSVSRRLQWVPARTQSGVKTQVCFNALTDAVQRAARCFTFHVFKCRYCMAQGETLQSLAQSFTTDWLQLWGANALNIEDPSALKLNELINIGTLYTAREGDTITSLAHRFRADTKALMAANPDVESEDQELLIGEPYCMLPGLCDSTEYRGP